MTSRDRLLDRLIGATLLAFIVMMEAGPAFPVLAAPAGVAWIVFGSWCLYVGYLPRRLRGDEQKGHQP